jgi:hypothetical protein
MVSNCCALRTRRMNSTRARFATSSSWSTRFAAQKKLCVPRSGASVDAEAWRDEADELKEAPAALGDHAGIGQPEGVSA